MPEIQKMFNISSHFILKDVDKIKIHHKRLENYKRVLLEERGKKNNLQLKEYIETELNTTILLVDLLANIITQRLLTGLSVSFIVTNWIKLTEYRFDKLINGETEFTKKELNDVLLFIKK
jgi:hypothetical protein